MKRIVAAFACCFVVTGCSWAFSRPPDRAWHRDRQQPPMCQPSYAAPVIDTWQAVGGGIMTLWAFGHASDDRYESESDTFALVGLVSGAVATMWGLSAHYGFKNARACKELRRELAQGPASQPPASQPPAQWVAPSVPAQADAQSEGPPVEVEQHVDVDERQIDIHTTVRPVKPRRSQQRN